MSKYTCITIGPIVATLMKARKTSELWAASYLFSLIMRRIVAELAGEDGKNQENIIIPYRKEELIHKEWWRDFVDISSEITDKSVETSRKEKTDPGVGLYLDHIVYHGEILDFENIKQKVFSEVANLLYTGGKKQHEIKDFLNNYIQLYYFIIENNIANFMQQINQVFDVLELQTKISQEGTYTLKDFFRELPDTVIFKRCFKTNNYLGDHCKSLVEIATAELPEKPGICVSEDEEDNYIRECRSKNKSTFFNYHKYYAVVQADGDKMSKFIQKVSVKDVSDALFNWAKKSVCEILHFGGLPVYAGGDDLLFFAPVNYRGKNLVKVLEEINSIFKKEVSDLLKGEKVGDDFREPSLSFGVVIAYYKYPLNEARDQAYSLLSEMKKLGGNGIRIKLLKHSNSDFDTVLRFQKDIFYNSFEELMKIPPEEIDDSEIRGITRRLREDERILKVVYMEEMSEHKKLSACSFIDNSSNIYAKKVNEHYKLRIASYFRNSVTGYSEDRPLLNVVRDCLEMMPEEIRNSIVKDRNGKDVGYYPQLMEFIYSLKEEPGKCYILLMFDMLRMVKFFKGIEEIK